MKEIKSCIIIETKGKKHCFKAQMTSNFLRSSIHASFEIASVLIRTKLQPLMLIKLTCIDQIQVSLGTHI